MKLQPILATWCLLASSLAFAQGALHTVRIGVDASHVENRITPYLYGACMEDVNHEIYGGLYDQQIFGESFEEPASLALFERYTILGGVWQREGEGLHCLPSPGAQLAVQGLDLKDGAAEVELKFNTTQGAFAGLVVRLNNPGIGADNFDGYEISLAADGSRIVFGKHEHNWQPMREIPAHFNPLDWNRLRVEMHGEELAILLNGKELFRHADTGTALRAGSVSFRNWDADVLLRNLTIENPTPQQVAFTTTPRPQVSWMWDTLPHGDAQALYTHLSDKAFNGKYAQRVEHQGDQGEVGIVNRALNHWGIALRKDSPMHGSIWLKEASAPVSVSLRSADGSRTYASQILAVKKSGKWTRHAFTLVPNADDPAASFVVSLDCPGRFTADMVTLHNDAARQYQGLPLRDDIARAMVDQGLTFLRYGGTMVNARQYRFKPMIGPRENRTPYTGHWYPYSTNGFGIVEFLAFCRAAGFESSFAVNIEETPQDMADLVEYLNGAADTPWGRKRAEEGYAEPFGVKYIEIGNEEVIHADDAAGYNHYIERFLLLAKAMREKDPSLRIINAAWWRPESPSMERVFRALDGVADYWDYHPWSDALNSAELIDRDLHQMQALFRKWNPQTTMKCVIFEENGVSHSLQRAIVHATIQNVVRRHGDFVLATCAANALQPYKQNDNGWDQGQIFFTPSQVWGMPTFYAQQLSAANHASQRVLSHVEGSEAQPDVTATLSDDGRTLILHLVNTSSESIAATLSIDGFRPIGKTAVYVLTGAPSDENQPHAPEHIVPTVRWYEQPGPEFACPLPPYSYTVVRIAGEQK